MPSYKLPKEKQARESRAEASTGSIPTETETNPGSIPFRAVLAIVGGILVHLTVGTYFTFGNFAPYFMSYMRNRTDTDLRNVDGLWVTGVGAVGSSVGMSVGGLLDRRFGPRVATAVGSFIFSASVLLTYVTVQRSFVAFVMTYGVIISFGTPCAYGPPVQTAIKWFPRRPALASGLIVSGFGGGALIFNQVITNYINPDNLSPDTVAADGDRYFTDPELLDRVPFCFLILGGSYVAMQVVGVLLLKPPPPPPSREQTTVSIDVATIRIPEEHQAHTHSIGNEHRTSQHNPDDQNGRKDREDQTITVTGGNDKSIPGFIEDTSQQAGTKPKRLYDMSPMEVVKHMLKSREFYIIWFTVLCVDGGMQFVIGLYKAYGQTFIFDDHFLALVGSVSSVFNCLGRPTWGVVMDRFGFRITIQCMTGMFVCLSATLLASEHLHRAFFFTWICLLYLCFSGIWSVAPSSLARLYGAKNMAVNYGFVYSAVSLAGIIGGVTGVTLKDVIGWHGLLFFSSGFVFLAFILSFFFKGKDADGKSV